MAEALLVRVHKALEALWDCTCTDRGECERCSTLRELDELIADCHTTTPNRLNQT